jgi:hypothetical protein
VLVGKGVCVGSSLMGVQVANNGGVLVEVAVGTMATEAMVGKLMGVLSLG